MSIIRIALAFAMFLALKFTMKLKFYEKAALLVTMIFKYGY